MEIQKERRYVTLILKDTRYKVHACQLSRRSRYFATLLSSDFCDHRLQEHVINYDIPISTFTNFVNWIETNYVMKIGIGRLLNKTMKIYCHKFDGILELLHLAVLFGVDGLIEDIVDIIERFWLVIAENLIEIWLVANELCLRMLRDISLAACLDLFDQLSIEKLLQLTKHEFTQLVANNNVRSTETSLGMIAAKWMDFNQEPLPCVLHKQKRKIAHFLLSHNNVESTSKSFHLSCWDGTKFFQYSICDYPKEFDKIPLLVGMHCVSRGTWNKGSNLPKNGGVTLIPEFCVFNERLIINMKDCMSLYIYCLNEDVWLVVKPNHVGSVLEINRTYNQPVYLLTYGDDMCYIHFKKDEAKNAVLTYISSSAIDCPKSYARETSTLRIRNCWDSPDGTDVLLLTNSGYNYVYVMTNVETNKSKYNCIVPRSIYVYTIITPPLKDWLSHNTPMFIPLLERYNTTACTDLTQEKKLLKIMDPKYLYVMSNSHDFDKCLKTIDCTVPNHSEEDASFIDTFLPKKVRRID